MNLTPEEEVIRNEAYKALRCLYIAAEAEVVDEVNTKVKAYIDLLESKRDWSTSFTLADIRDAFIAGGKEVKDNIIDDNLALLGNFDCVYALIERASDGYSKLIQLNKTDEQNRTS